MRAATRKVSASPWRPFLHRDYAVIWSATVVANTGSWMYAAASAWLMTSLDADPLMVSLVQVAASLPMFFFALPAGALADIIDKRKFLIAVESSMACISAIYAVFVWRNLVTPANLLVFVFLVESGTALSAAAWQSIVPMLVPRGDLPPAIALNSAGVNLSRAIGPALSGLLTSAVGVAAPFFGNAISNSATISALVWWRPPARLKGRLPAERLASAVRTGIRYSRNNPPLRATLIRAVAFFLFASAYWALLPLIARKQINGGPGTYGLLLGAIGAGAVAGTFFLPWLKSRLTADRVVAAGSALTGVALVLYGLAQAQAIAFLASVMAGIAWIAVLSSLNVSAQFSLPEWVRGRGLAVYVTVFFGAMTIGSIAWGELAGHVGLPAAHLAAAAGILLAIPLTRRWKLLSDSRLDLTPSMHWPTPTVAKDVDRDQGPVLVTVEYRVVEPRREAFLRAMEPLARERRRDGAYAWGIFEDLAQPGRFVETFMIESWLEHLRQHERVTNADRIQQERVLGLLEEAPRVTHLVAADRDADR